MKGQPTRGKARVVKEKRELAAELGECDERSEEPRCERCEERGAARSGEERAGARGAEEGEV